MRTKIPASGAYPFHSYFAIETKSSAQKYEKICKNRYFWGNLAMISALEIKETAARVGFDLCGIAPCRHIEEGERRFRAWLDEGCQAQMHYLERNIDKRFDPTLLVDGAKSVVVCAINYKNRFSSGYPDECRTKIASYALNRDYHRTLKEMLYTLLNTLTKRHPTLLGRVFTDSAPIVEKWIATEAGLGWIGRQSLLVTPRFGTYVLLGEVVLKEECDSYDEPIGGDRCGSCRACIQHCPNGAIRSNRTIDASRCISCRTIENAAGDTPPDLHGWIFGCDLCQSCCPHNRLTPEAAHPAFSNPIDPLPLDRVRWLSMTDEEFAAIFGETPLTRSGLNRIRENVY